MTRLNKRDWLMAGLHLLAEQGAAALTIETLTTALGVTKGSFYHHFRSFADYKTSVLSFFEQESTLDVIAQIEQDTSAARRLVRLFDVATGSTPLLEIAVRAWARQDAEVRAVQARIDAQRMQYVAQLCVELVTDPAQAERMSQLAYVILIGSTQLEPPLPPATCRTLFDEFLRLYQIDQGAR